MTSSAPLDPLAMALAASLARKFGIKWADESIVPAAIERPQRRIAEVTNRKVTVGKWTVPVRIYRPSLGKKLPILIYVHGGGWFSGGLDPVDANCRELSARADCAVVSIQYSLAPVNKFPRALEEVDEVCRWVGTHADTFGGDSTRLAIGGESVGANMAAAACLLARARCKHSPFSLQLLVYPVLNPDMNRPELAAARDPILTKGILGAMWRQYTACEEDWRNPLVSPLSASSLADLPPALIITAGVDPLRTEGAEFAAALQASGVAATHRNYDGMFHGFFGLPHPLAEDAMVGAVATLQNAFASAVTPRDMKSQR